MPSPNHRPRASLASTSTGAAIRRGDLKISDPIPFSESRDMFTSSASVPSPGFASAYRPNDTTWPHQSPPPREYHNRHVSEVPVNMTLRNSAGPSLIPSSMSSVPSKSSMSQKKPRGLRAALMRMFKGRKHQSAPAQANNYHYSDPGQLLPVNEQHQPTQPEPPQPRGHAIPPQALTSHSIHSNFAENLPSPPRRRRRNTLPSLVFSEKDLDSLAALSTETKRAKEDCVSDGQLKRRSRSADQLNEALRSSGMERSPTRDRASEIAYWRNSAIENPVPVYSGQSIAVDPVHVTGPVSSTEESERGSSSAANPMQAFDFGLDLSTVDNTSLSQRINTLEIKLIDFEYAIAKLQGTKLSNPVRDSRHFAEGQIDNVFPADRADTTLASSSSQDSSYPASSSPNTVNNMSFLSSPGDSPPLSPEREDLFRPQRSSKATTATITPYNSKSKTPPPPDSPTSIHIPLDKFAALLEMVKDEKAARLRLEEQVMELQKEVESLKAPVYASIREAPYPTPSPESSHHPPATPRALHRSPGFQLNYPPPEISRFSGTDQESENDQEEEEGFEEVYETPLENSRKTFEISRDDVRLPVI
ncbi:hypothetical protein PV08_06694 [Exophiala spinifera]|uniref:Uncharacterized protein n=1 Tax=Exophiala spinifera TaxID=91928 RepID=A0A0D2B4R1_9EURO|nr:uncharacterized protein PV08_06694 [Exophiala spinifera]KIW13913.1 hypothetical protein PV08_06694 [Exophiala spinifera]